MHVSSGGARARLVEAATAVSEAEAVQGQEEDEAAEGRKRAKKVIKLLK